MGLLQSISGFSTANAHDQRRPAFEVGRFCYHSQPNCALAVRLRPKNKAYTFLGSVRFMALKTNRCSDILRITIRHYSTSKGGKAMYTDEELNLLLNSLMKDYRDSPKVVAQRKAIDRKYMELHTAEAGRQWTLVREILELKKEMDRAFTLEAFRQGLYYQAS